jgi:hypothetical protein
LGASGFFTDLAEDFVVRFFELLGALVAEALPFDLGEVGDFGAAPRVLAGFNPALGASFVGDFLAAGLAEVGDPEADPGLAWFFFEAVLGLAGLAEVGFWLVWRPVFRSMITPPLQRFTKV